jgi:hypothetical protein
MLFRPTYRFFVVLLSSFCLLGFSWLSSTVEPEQFIAHYKNHSQLLQVEKTQDQCVWTLRYVPEELSIIRQFYAGGISETEAQAWLNEKSSTYTFVLELEIPSLGNAEFLSLEHPTMNYEARVKYYAFGLKNDIQFSYNKQDFKPIMGLEFERNYGASNKGTFIITLPREKKSNELHVKIEDRVYGTEALKLTFNLEPLQDFPSLKNVKKWKKQNV